MAFQDVRSRNDMSCTVVRCGALGWLSKLMDADFGGIGSSSVASKGSVRMLAHAIALRKFFSI